MIALLLESNVLQNATTKAQSVHYFKISVYRGKWLDDLLVTILAKNKNEKISTEFKKTSIEQERRMVKDELTPQMRKYRQAL